MSRKLGVNEEQLRGLIDFEARAAFKEVEKLVLRYAVAMTETPVEVPDELFNALRAHFNEKQMVELTAIIAWENYRARFDHAFGIESMNFTAGAYCALLENKTKERSP